MGKHVRIESENGRTRVLDEQGLEMTSVLKAVVEFDARTRTPAVELTCLFPTVKAEGTAEVRWVSEKWLNEMLFEVFADLHRRAHRLYVTTDGEQADRLWGEYPEPLKSTADVVEKLEQMIGELNR
jgi:hypothetical protein